MEPLDLMLAIEETLMDNGLSHSISVSELLEILGELI
jgi:hypothetical protein